MVHPTHQDYLQSKHQDRHFANMDVLCRGLLSKVTLLDGVMLNDITQYIFYKRDPRRAQPLVDYLCEEFHSMDYNGESSFDAIRTLSLFRAFYEELNWKFSAWADETIARCWPEICSEHDDVSLHQHHTLLGSKSPLKGARIRRRNPSILRQGQGNHCIHTAKFRSN